MKFLQCSYQCDESRPLFPVEIRKIFELVNLVLGRPILKYRKLYSLPQFFNPRALTKKLKRHMQTSTYPYYHHRNNT